MSFPYFVWYVIVLNTFPRQRREYRGYIVGPYGFGLEICWGKYSRIGFSDMRKHHGTTCIRRTTKTGITRDSKLFTTFYHKITIGKSIVEFMYDEKISSGHFEIGNK